MNNVALQSTLFVFGVTFYLVAYVAFQALRARLATVPRQAAALQQQIETLAAEAGNSQQGQLRAGEEHAQLSLEIESMTTRRLLAEQTLHELQNRLPTIIYVLDQIIQPSYTSWMISVRWEYPPKGVPEAVAEEMRRGRRILVFADNVANVRRRIEARFPPTHGHHLGEPVPYNF
jgi:hypothetical protein